MRNWIFLCFLLVFSAGCSTANMNKLNNLRNDNKKERNLITTLNYSKEAVFNAALSAIQSKTKAIIHYSDLTKGEIYAQTSFGKAFQSALQSFGTNPTGTGSNLGIFLEGDNPTKIRIA